MVVGFGTTFVVKDPNAPVGLTTGRKAQLFDNDAFYPKNRRCVVFKTGPIPADCPTCRAATGAAVFPWSATDAAVIPPACPGPYPKGAQPCPLAGTCSFDNATCATSYPDSQAYYGVGIPAPTYGCGKSVIVQVSALVL